MKMEATDGRSIPREVLEHYRFRAIELRKEGKQVNEIAHFFGVHRCAVSHWLTNYNRKGEKALKKRKAPGPGLKLSENELNEIIKILHEDAMKYGFESPLWTCQRIKQIIKRKFGKSLHSTNIMRWLKKWGMTYQKPERLSPQRDEEAIEKWEKEKWPKIKAHVRRWQAILYFQDESSILLAPVLGKTWAIKGKTPSAKVSGRKDSFRVTSAISPAGRMVFRIEKKKVNSEEHINFLKQILKHHPNRKIVVIEDNASIHKSKKVKDFIKDTKQLAVYHLPKYAPELNPDEHVWAYLKAYQLKTHQAQTTKELKKLVKRKMQSIQKTKGLVNSFFIGSYVL